MKHVLRALAVSALFLVLASSCISDKGTDKVKAGDKLPKFSLSSETYGDLNSSDLKGKVTYLVFFATWCPSCQKEMAAVRDTMFPEFGDEEDFLIVAVGREHTEEELTEYNERMNFRFPVYPDPDRSVYSLFASETIPRAYLVGRDGVIVDAATGYDPEHFSEVMDTVRRLLQE